MRGSSERWVLVTDGGHGGSRDCVAAVRGLTAGGYSVAVTVSPGTSRAALSRHCKRRIFVPRVDEDGFCEAIRKEVSTHDYLAVLPASEAALLTLGVSTPHLTNKDELERAALKVGLTVPRSRLVTAYGDIAAAASEIGYPLVIKPARRTFSALRINGPGELSRLEERGQPVVLQSWVDEGLTGVSGVVWQGRLVAATHEKWLRIWPPECGLACAALTVRPDEDLESKLVALMTGYDGPFCAQFAGPHLIDLNLRVGSLHPLSVTAGANLLSIYCSLLEGKDVAETRGRPGHFFRWLEGDLRHVFRAWRSRRMGAGTALRALRPRRGTAHSLESIGDPAPILARLTHGASRAHLSVEERSRGSR